MSPEEMAEVRILLEKAYNAVNKLPKEVKKTLPWKISKQNTSHADSRIKVKSYLEQNGSLTFPEAKELGLVPKDMKGTTWRRVIVVSEKGSNLGKVGDLEVSKQSTKPGVPVVYHTKGNARMLSKTYSEANEEAAKSVVPLFNGYQTVDPLKVMKESGNYTFVKSLLSDKSAKVKFLDMIYTEAIGYGWDLNSTTFKFTKRREVQI